MARTNAVNVNQHRHRGTGNAVEERRERDEGDSLLLAPRREGFRCVASPLHTESPVRRDCFKTRSVYVSVPVVCLVSHIHGTNCADREAIAPQRKPQKSSPSAYSQRRDRDANIPCL